MLNLIKKLFLAMFGDAVLVPECAYCAAMRYALVSATLTGAIFGIGLKRFVAFTLIGAFIGIIQVVFLVCVYRMGEEGE